MFYHFPFGAIGFTPDEWEIMPRTDRMVIKSWYLNGRNDERTALFEEYESARQVQNVKRRYSLQERPVVHFSWQDFTLY